MAILQDEPNDDLADSESFKSKLEIREILMLTVIQKMLK